MHNMRSLCQVIATFAVGVSALWTADHAAHAGSAADALLNSVQPGQAETKASEPVYTQLHLDDPFVIQLFSTWKNQVGLSYEVNSWVQRILSRQFEEAAHLVSTLEMKIPEAFEEPYRFSYAYLLFKLGLSQSFVDEWVKLLAVEKRAQSPFALALEQMIETTTQGFTNGFASRQIQLTQEQRGILSRFPPTRSKLFLEAHLYMGLRSGAKAIPLLGYIDPSHPLKIPLSETAALSLAKSDQLGEAARILRDHLEPAIDKKGSVRDLARYYLQIARLLYQAGALDGAETFYLKIPNSVAQFPKAREELTWIWLRKNDTQSLRGHLSTLNSKLFEERFAPELWLVQAISDLKFCLYTAVKSDFANFNRVNTNWAKKIELALAASETPAPPALGAGGDWFLSQAEAAVPQLQAEATELARLEERSVGAVLPAVGPQKHWTALRAEIARNVDLVKKSLGRERRQRWESLASQLKEAIRKMQFVKVELLSQVRLGQVPKAAGTTALQKSDREIAFKFDGVLWPDEPFHLKSVTDGVCRSAAASAGGQP